MEGEANKMTVECGRTRRLLWPNNGLQAVTAEIVEARRHLETCAECAEFFAEMRTLRDGIRRAVPRTAAPLEVRDRLFKTISQARTQSAPRLLPRPHLVAAAAVAAVLLLLVGTREFVRNNNRSPESALIPILAEEHARALGEAGIKSSDANEISRWLNGRVAFAIHVPVFDEASLKGARVLELEGRRGALVEYALGGDLVSYFVFADYPTPSTGSPLDLKETIWDGYRVVSWTEPGVLHAFVGNVPRSKLRMLARKCIEQAGMMAALIETISTLD